MKVPGEYMKMLIKFILMSMARSRYSYMIFGYVFFGILVNTLKIYVNNDLTWIDLFLKISLLPLLLAVIDFQMNLKQGFKEFYYTLPFNREQLFIVEVMASIAITTILFFTIEIDRLVSLFGNISFTLKMALCIVFIALSLAILSDLRWISVFKIILALLLLPLIVDELLHLYMRHIHIYLEPIFEILPHRIVLYSIGLYNLSGIGEFNILLSLLYILGLSYLGIWRKERLNVY